MSAVLKTCRKCGIAKSADPDHFVRNRPNFSMGKRRPDTYHETCKECESAAKKAAWVLRKSGNDAFAQASHAERLRKTLLIEAAKQGQLIEAVAEVPAISEEQIQAQEEAWAEQQATLDKDRAEWLRAIEGQNELERMQREHPEEWARWQANRKSAKDSERDPNDVGPTTIGEWIEFDQKRSGGP